MTAWRLEFAFQSVAASCSRGSLVPSRRGDPAACEKERVMSADAKRYEGQCSCGAVRLVVSGDPAGAGYCHCKTCRSWSASPINAFTLWPTGAVQVTEGEDQIGEFNANEQT